MKNLKSEYIALTNDNVPDLWDRIEAGIDLSMQEKAEEKNSGTDKVIEIKSNSKRSFRRYIPIAAAAAVLIFSCRMVLMFNSNKHLAATATEAASEEPLLADESAASFEADESDMAFEAEESAFAEEEAFYDEAPAMAETNEASAMAETNEVSEMAEINETEEFSKEAFCDEAMEPTEGAPAYECEGYITICDDKHFIDVSIENGKAIRMYVPDYLVSDVEFFAEKNQMMHIEYDDLDEKTVNSFDEEYKNVALSVSYICIK